VLWPRVLCSIWIYRKSVGIRYIPKVIGSNILYGYAQKKAYLDYVNISLHISQVDSSHKMHRVEMHRPRKLNFVQYARDIVT
jgi:hypothetical protein